MIKDVSILLHNRKEEDIIVVETEPHTVDTECLSSIEIAPYDGTVNYQHLSMLKQAVKNINNTNLNEGD